MLDLLNDPEIDKLIIYGLAGVCAVLLIAVIFLAVKKNVYYIDEDGDEVVEEKPRRRSRKKKEEPVKEEVRPVQEEIKPAVIAEEPAAEPVLLDEAPEEIEHTTVVDLRSFSENAQPEEELEATRVSIPAFPEEPVEEETVIAEEPHTKEVPLAVREPAAKSAVVEVTINGNTEHREIEYFPCLIGRDASSCNLVISEPAVSRRHARIFVSEDVLYVEDVSEHNGTYVNGTKLASLGRTELHEGDRISLGRAEITISKLLY